MALNIRNTEAERLAAELADLTGESKTEAVTKALRSRLSQLKGQLKKRSISARLDEIALHCASLPVRDTAGSGASLYDERGLPG